MTELAARLNSGYGMSRSVLCSRVVDAVHRRSLIKRVDVQLLKGLYRGQAALYSSYPPHIPQELRRHTHYPKPGLTKAMPPRGKRKAREETPDRDEMAVSPPPVKRAMASSSSTAVVNFFTPTSQKAPPVDFVMHGTLMAASWGPTTSSKTTTTAAIKLQETNIAGGSKKAVASSVVTTEESITLAGPGTASGNIKFAGFDLDSNLINTKSKKTFARDADDWEWWHSSVPAKLQQMVDEGYRLVLFTNQNGLKASHKQCHERRKEWKQKINYIVTALNLPISIYAATESDIYRKPRTGMYEQYLSDLGADAAFVDLEGSMFVGDAAGRKGDFSASDRKFAENIGVKFLTPEELFLGQSPAPYSFDLDPASLPKTTDALEFTKKYPLELVVLCGRPASGKSTLTQKHLEPLGYQRVNQDILKTKAKCIKAAEGYLKEGKSVVIDATNSSKDVRAGWKDVANRIKGTKFRCIYLTTPEGLCQHNDGVRAYCSLNSLNPENRTSVGSMAFMSFRTKFQEPELNEGFEDITVINFEFRGSDAEYDVWKRHWS